MGDGVLSNIAGQVTPEKVGKLSEAGQKLQEPLDSSGTVAPEADGLPGAGDSGAPPAPQQSSGMAIGMSLSAEYTRKFSFEASASTKITTKMVALPPPAALLEAIAESVAGRKK